MKRLGLALVGLLAGCFHFVPWSGELRERGAVVRVERVDVTIGDTMGDRPRVRRSDVWLRVVAECGGAKIDEQLGGLARAARLFGPSELACGDRRIVVDRWSERGAWLRVATR